MKILVYENRKEDPLYLDASTPEKEDNAFRELFKYLDTVWHVYCNYDDDRMERAVAFQNEIPEEEKWYMKAKAGDIKYIKLLMKRRKKEEYEEWSFAEVRDKIR